MKLKVVKLGVAAAAIALIAGCGGGGSAPQVASVNLSGTAAVGAALAGADVQIKCAEGSGATTTSTTGGYTVSIEGAKLPCIIKVTGTTNSGAAVTLHSVAEPAAAGADGDTTIVANVTPVTEMIVAQLMETMPENSFASFDPALVTAEALTSATTVIVDALKAAGIDLSGIGDPLKAILVPATDATAGNAYDILLDSLGDQVSVEALPLLVNQIATAAATDSAATLDAAITAVAGGGMEGCPAVLSGKYRTVEYYGRTTVREVDFKNKKFMSGNGVDSYDIVIDPNKPCEFVASGTINGTTSVFHVAMGPNGVGAFRAQQTAPSVTPGVTGYLFPVQAHDASALAGTWTFLQSGFDPDEGHVHWLGEAVISGSTAQLCDYDKSAGWGCLESSRMSLNIAARSDGGFDLQEGSDTPAQLYAYRAPNGSVNVFGTTNAAGTTGSTVQQTSIVLTKRVTLALREVGSVSKSWDVDTVVRSTGRVTVVPTQQSNTVTAVDASTGAVTRRRDSDCRVDTILYNKPITGMIMRDAGTYTNCEGSTLPLSAVYILPLSGLGVTTAISQQQGGTTFPAGPHIYSIGLQRP